MRNITNDTRNTFGYSQFATFDDNGNLVENPNQIRFDSEIFSGLNTGIQYKRDSEVDQYAKMYTQAAIDDRQAADAFNRQLILKGLDNGSLLYNPHTGEIKVNPALANPDGGQGRSIFDIDTSDVDRYDFTSRNENVTKQLNSLGIKEGQIKISQNQDDGSSSVSGFRDDKIKALGIKDSNGNVIDNKVDLYVWARVDADVDNAKRVISSIDQETYLFRPFVDGYGGRQDLDEYITNLENSGNLTNDQRNMISEYRSAKNIVDERTSRYADVPKEFRMTEREYDNLKNAFEFDKDASFGMNDLERVFLYSKGHKPNYADQ